MAKVVRAKKHRLPDEAYAGMQCVSFTICVEDRTRVFQTDHVVRPLVAALETNTSLRRCLVPIYCFMPDHIHVLTMGLEDESNGKKAIEGFKYSAGKILTELGYQGRLQRGFHDHIIRQSEDWRRHVFYVLQNPVRAGLCQNPYAYPFTGSIGYDLHELVQDAAW